jgi:hypothetical protein
MKKQLLILLFSGLGIIANAQTGKYWSSSEDSRGKIPTDKAVSRVNFPIDFKLFSLNIEPLRQELFSIVGKNNNGSKTIISLPNADGQMEQFEVFETSNFDDELQARFPEIRAFSGKSLTDKYATLKLSISPQGIQTMVFRTDKKNEFIEPYSKDHTVYAVFKSQRTSGKLAWSCSTDDKKMVDNINSQLPKTNKSSAGQLKTMRLAQSCTAEYSNYFGANSAANVALVLAAFNATLTRGNGVYEKDLALHLNLVAASTNVIYYNPATDPYSAAAVGSGGVWNYELMTTLSNNALVGNANFDVGHLFGASGGGGNAGCIGCVCDNTMTFTTDVNGVSHPDSYKGSGYTSPGDAIPQGDNFDIDYVVHEVGHQLGGNHTFTHTTENNAVNYEPGSGSTIMGYAGITARDIAAHSNDYYHAGSIQQIQTNLTGKACPVNTAITHGAPVVTAGLNYTIPKSTPFALTGSATDAGGGALTYCWEQFDEATTNGMLCGDNPQTGALGDNDCIPVATKTTGAIFRSYSPTASPIRYFPKMSSILDGTYVTSGPDIASEVLPSVARTMNFRLTVRDNVAGQGQTGFGNMTTTVDATKGPLTVTSQNTAGIVWAQGSTQTINWASNGTNVAFATNVAGDQFVDILLSTDNGSTFSTVLASNTPNDGTENITVPNITAANCRIMIKAHSHIFFNVNTKNIAIGNYVYQSVNTCTDYVMNFGSLAIPEDSASYVGYNRAVTDAFTVTDANVKVELTHGNIGTLRMGIIPPGGASVQSIFNGGRPTAGDVVCTTADMNILFDAQAATFSCANSNNNSSAKPPTLSATFPNPLTTNVVGINSAGNWGFYFTDIDTADGVTGTIEKVIFNLCQSTLVPVLSVENFDFENFSLYPNPNNGDFTVKFTSSSTNDIKINVHDMRGRQVYEKSFSNTGVFNQNINLSKVEAGIYLVSIVDGAKKTVKRIVVE